MALAKSQDDFIIRVGQVIEIFEDEISHPHNKIHIIVGLNDAQDEVASLFVNSSDIRFADLPDLARLQYPIFPKQCPFISHPSFVDCSELRKGFPRKFHQGMKKGGRIRGQVNAKDLFNILQLLKSSDTILPYFLEHYNII